MGTAEQTPTNGRYPTKRERRSLHERNLFKIKQMKKLLLKIEANFVVHEDFGRFSGVVMSLYETMYRNHGLEYTCT